MTIVVSKNKVRLDDQVLTVSSGNTKLGNIPNLNLPPLVTCIENPPCAKLCYARKAYEGYAAHSCKSAWDGNLQLWQESIPLFQQALDAWLAKYKPAYFRWHSSGDIPDRDYWCMMLRVAVKNPGTRFLCYSRRSYAWSDAEHMANIPNLRILRSLWIDEAGRDEYRPWFKVLSKDELWYEPTCPGSCSNCLICWHLLTGEGRTIRLH
jgi:hypothetical protein